MLDLTPVALSPNIHLKVDIRKQEKDRSLLNWALKYKYNGYQGTSNVVLRQADTSLSGKSIRIFSVNPKKR